MGPTWAPHETWCVLLALEVPLSPPEVAQQVKLTPSAFVLQLPSTQESGRLASLRPCSRPCSAWWTSGFETWRILLAISGKCLFGTDALVARCSQARTPRTNVAVCATCRRVVGAGSSVVTPWQLREENPDVGTTWPDTDGCLMVG